MRPFTHPDWMWEPKLDGYRVLAFVARRRGQAALAARPRPDAGLPAARRRTRQARQCSGMILDGEIVAFDADGRPSFDALQNRAQLKTRARDRGGRARHAGGLLLLRPAALRRRRPAPGALRAIAAAISRSACCRRRSCSSCTRTTTASRCTPRRWRQRLRGRRSASARDSRYEAGRRSASWLKVKPTQSAEFVVGGYTRGKGARAPLGALLLGYWERGQAALRVARRLGLRRATARAGEGSARTAADRATCPFAENAAAATRRRPGSSPKRSPR